MTASQVLLGVSGGIAAYKTVSVLRALTKAGCQVRVVPTANALKFVGAPVWEALSGQACHPDCFTNTAQAEHIQLGRWAQLFIIAPATANTLSKLVQGAADDLLTASFLTARCPTLIVPAMHPEMWLNPATVANVAILRQRGYTVMEPASGALAGSDTGVGRMPEPEVIAACALARMQCSPGLHTDLTGKKVVITAGGTHEPLDPVRFIGNHSTGKQGAALARMAWWRGAEVVVIAAHTEPLELPPAVRQVQVSTALEMQAAVETEIENASVLIMAAAVADFRLATPADQKIAKDPATPGLDLSLIQNPDILADVAHRTVRPAVVVGFAAQTGSDSEVLQLGQAKARAKGADLLVINQVGPGIGFGQDTNRVTIVDHKGQVGAECKGSKDLVANTVLDAVIELLGQ